MATRELSEQLGTTVGTTLTIVDNIDVRHIDTLMVHIDNTGATAFNAFNIYGSGHKSVPLQLLFTGTATPEGILLGASADLTTLANGVSGWVLLDVKALFQVEIRASVASGTTTTNSYAGGA